MNPSTTPQTWAYYQRYVKDELSSPLALLRPEERCLVNDLRDWAWANDGIAGGEEALESIALRLGFTRYRFRKIWPKVEAYFVKISEKFYYNPDQAKRERHLEVVAKRKESGGLGGRPPKYRQGESQNWEKANGFQPEPEAEPKPEGYLHHHQESGETEMAEAAVSPEPAQKPEPESFALVSPISQQDFETFVTHCASARLSAPSRALCARLKAKFPDKSAAEIVCFLPRTANQHSPGLWDHMTREQLELETLNQRIQTDNPPRKKSAAEVAHEELYRVAREVGFLKS